MKVFIVTGASRGFGRSTVLELAKSNLIGEESAVLLVGRNEAGLAETLKLAQEVSTKKATVLFKITFSTFLADFSSSDLDAICTQLLSAASALLLRSPENSSVTLVNNAGSLGHLGRIRGFTAAAVRDALEVNVVAPMVLTSKFLDTFGSKAAKAFVINVSSLAAIEPFDCWSIYASGKAARDMFHRSVVVEELQIQQEENLGSEPARVRVLNYAPGPLDTEMQKEIRESMPDVPLRKIYEEMYAQGKLVSPDASATVMWKLIASDKYKNGEHKLFHIWKQNCWQIAPAHKESGFTLAQCLNNVSRRLNPKMTHRRQRQDISKTTIQNIEDGFYTNDNGEVIDLATTYQHSLTGTQLFLAKDPIPQKLQNSSHRRPRVIFKTCTTLQAAEAAEASGATRVGVLNFASAKKPGGGFRKGASAQEESLARSSTLGALLESSPRFYQCVLGRDATREDKIFYTHSILYSPQVSFFKRDDGSTLPRPYEAGVVTCAAVNAGLVQAHPEHLGQIEEVMYERIRRIAQVFELNEHDVLILGAFGCGVFRNPVEMVTRLFYRVFVEEGRYSFDQLIFAVTEREKTEVMEALWTSLDMR
ncbi:hypothetical protein HDU96_008441 [Phlyctochytrium bullatum]|nr:hypothetical protein HDU96_008441 [Phlyctochytrium bullatum]